MTARNSVFGIEFKGELYFKEEKAVNSFYEDYFKGEYEKLKDTFGDSDVTENEPPAPIAVGVLRYGIIRRVGDSVFVKNVNGKFGRRETALLFEIKTGAFSDFPFRILILQKWEFPFTARPIRK